MVSVSVCFFTPVISRRRRWCVCFFVSYCMHSLGRVQGSWAASDSYNTSGFLSHQGPPQDKGSDTSTQGQDSTGEKGDDRKLHADLPAKIEQPANVHTHLVSLCEALRRESALLHLGRVNDQSTSVSNLQGSKAVTFFFPLTLRERSECVTYEERIQNDADVGIPANGSAAQATGLQEASRFNKTAVSARLSPAASQITRLRTVFPFEQAAPMISAIRGHSALYRCREGLYFWTLEDEDQKSFTFGMWFVRRKGSKLDIRRALREVEGFLSMHRLFGLRSLDAVQSTFRLQTPKDILMHPYQRGHLFCPGGAYLNCVLLFSPVRTTLMDLLRTIEENEGKSSKMNKLAEIARLNLTLQLVQLLGQLSLRGIVLPRLPLKSFRLDDSGTLYCLPSVPPRKRESGDTFKPTVSTSDMSPAETWPEFSLHTNAMDGALVLIYIWCPAESESSLLSVDTATIKRALATVSRIRCRSMLEDVRRIVYAIFHRDIDMGTIVFSTSYLRLYTRLENKSKTA